MTDHAEKLSRRRAFLLMLFASTYLIWQVPSMDWVRGLGESRRMADNIADIGQILWVIALLVFLVMGGRFLRNNPSPTQTILNDELVRSHRETALQIGYAATMLTTSVLFLITRFQPMEANDVARMVMAAGVAAPLYTFAFLERRHG